MESLRLYTCLSMNTSRSILAEKSHWCGVVVMVTVMREVIGGVVPSASARGRGRVRSTKIDRTSPAARHSASVLHDDHSDCTGSGKVGSRAELDEMR